MGLYSSLRRRKKCLIKFIDEWCQNQSRIFILGSRLLYTFLLKLLDEDEDIPKIDIKFITKVFSCVCKHSGGGSKSSLNHEPFVAILDQLVVDLGINKQALPSQHSHFLVYIINTYFTNIKNHLLRNLIVYTRKYLLVLLKEEFNGAYEEHYGRMVRQIIDIEIIDKQNDYAAPEQIKQRLEIIHERFHQQFGSYLSSLDKGGKWIMDRIKYIYQLSKVSEHEVKLVPLASFTIKNITIDKRTIKTLFDKSHGKSRKKSQCRKKQAHFNSVFKFNKPKGYHVSSMLTNGVELTILFERHTSTRKRKYQWRYKDKGPPSKKRRLNNNIDVDMSETDGEPNNNNHQVIDATPKKQVVGVDLGRKSIFVSYRKVEDENDEKKPKQAEPTKYRRHKLDHWSNGHWQFESGVLRKNRKLKKWKDNQEEFMTTEGSKTIYMAEEELMSLGIANNAEHAIQSFKRAYINLPVLTGFYFKHRHQRLLFWTYGRRQRAMVRLCNAIAGDSDIIAIGDPLFDPSSKFYTPAPTKAIVKRLKQLYPTKVHIIDEYNTSKLCSKCFSKLKFTNMKTRSNKTDVRVQRCTNPKCKIVWNRDFNSARNMARLYVHERDNNGARLAPFQRPDNDN